MRAEVRGVVRAGGAAAGTCAAAPTWTPRNERIDWLADSAPFVARVSQTYGPSTLSLDNGLVRREFRLEPNAACTAFDQRSTGASRLRAIRPEACATLDGVELPTRGLVWIVAQRTR